MHLPKFKKMRYHHWTPSRLLASGFIMLIMIGTILLSLPVSTRKGHGIPFLDALFTSTSAVCVTGLVVVDTCSFWSPFGQLVILALIQIGALGIMSIVTLYSVMVRRQIGLTGRLAIVETLSNSSMENIVKLFMRILLFTLSLETAGTLILSAVLIPEFGFSAGLGKSIFLAISAFCNAGFDLFGSEANQFVSLTGFQDNPVILLTTAALIISGGLGFMVWQDFNPMRKLDKFSLHTRIVLVMTSFLLVTGTIGFLVLESGNTMSGFSFPQKVLNAFFQSATTRTAGFNTLPTFEMRDSSNHLSLLLMFIGASPGSTGGGVKVTTIFVLFAAIVAFTRSRNDIHAFKWRIGTDIVMRSLVIFILGLGLVFLATFLLLADGNHSFLASLYEAVSAFGTVGLSTGITPSLHPFSKYVLILTMLLGRIAPITAIMAFSTGQEQANVTFRYPEGKINVG